MRQMLRQKLRHLMTHAPLRRHRRAPYVYMMLQVPASNPHPTPTYEHGVACIMQVMHILRWVPPTHTHTIPPTNTGWLVRQAPRTILFICSMHEHGAKEEERAKRRTPLMIPLAALPHVSASPCSA